MGGIYYRESSDFEFARAMLVARAVWARPTATCPSASRGALTPRRSGTIFDAVKFGIKLSVEVPKSIQERAYTAPIWYSPS